MFVSGSLLAYSCLEKYTVKPVNKGHPRERQHMVFIDKWSLFGGNLFYFIKEGLLKYVPYLQDGLYLQVAINTGLTVNIIISLSGEKPTIFSV